MMMNEEIDAILENIRGESEGQEDRINRWIELGSGLDSDQRYAAVERMMAQDLWFWLPVICRILDEEIHGPHFLPIIDLLSNRIGENVAREIFWSGLVDAGQRRPEEAIQHARELTMEGSWLKAVFASALLAGAARDSPDEVLALLPSIYGSEEPSTRSIALLTMNITLNESTLPKEDLLDIVLSHPIPREEKLRLSYSMTLRLLHPLNRDATESRLRELLRSSSERVREQVMHDLGVLDRVSIDTRTLMDEYSSR
jgi:hypothetical protein